MIKSILIALMLFPFAVRAQCEKAAAAYGNGEGADHIPSECFHLAQKLAQEHARKTYKKSQVSVVGYKNILYVDGQIFAGEYTLLQEVVAVAYDEKNFEVAALEKNGDVLIFNSKLPGNVAPVRVIRHQDLDGATNVAFLPTAEIAVHMEGRKETLTFSRLANFYGREGNKKLGIRRQILNAAALGE